MKTSIALVRVFRSVILLLLLSSMAFCQDTKPPSLHFDHIVIFVSNDDLKRSLDQFFTPAEKLTTAHKNQGTTGHYYLFYNTYIELLYLTDSAKARINQDLFGSDYVGRWSGKEDVSPIAFGMNMMPWDTAFANANYHKYQSFDAAPDEYYLMSRQNSDLSSPLIYVSMPNRAYQAINSMEDVEDRPAEIRDDMRKYLTHPVSATELSKVVYSTHESLHASDNLKLLESSPMIKVEPSETDQLELIFGDGQIDEKEFRVNPGTKLIVRY